MVTYKKDGIEVNGIFISLTEINDNCRKELLKDEYRLLTIEWKGSRGFKGIKEQIVMLSQNIETLKSYIIGRSINFGEIAGKHSEICGIVEESDMTITDDKNVIAEFIKENPSWHSFNESFLFMFITHIYDGNYGDLGEQSADYIESLFSQYNQF